MNTNIFWSEIEDSIVESQASFASSHFAMAPLKTKAKIKSETPSRATKKDPKKFKNKKLSYGSFFSGMDTCLMALRLALRAAFGPCVSAQLQHSFAIDNNPKVKAFLLANVDPDCVVYGDVRTINLSRLPRVEVVGTHKSTYTPYQCCQGPRVWAEGFQAVWCICTFAVPIEILWYSPPCQAYSPAGKLEGWTGDGNYNDGTLVQYPMKYIKKHRPTIAIMENVPTLKTRFPEVFDTIFHGLECIGKKSYDVRAMTLNTKEYGLPQHRNRLFIVALAKHALKTEFFPPAPAPRASLKDMLDCKLKGKFSTQPEWLIANIIYAYGKIIKQGGDPFKEMWVADVRASRKWSPQVCDGFCPTITASRGGQGGFWVSSLCRFLTVREMGKLQGIDMDSIIIPPSVSEAQLGRMVGNSVSVSVAALLFGQVFTCLR